MAHMTMAERALQAWQVLICAAHNRQTITYEQLAKRIGMGDVGRVVAGPIDRLYNYCTQKELPYLTYLVVSRVTGRPMPDFPDLDQQRERVFEYPWFSRVPVQVKGFEL